MKNRLNTRYLQKCSGFTLLEIMLVVAIIGLLTVLAIPYFMKHRMRVENITFMDQQRILLASLDRQAITEGNYPPDSPVATMPANLSEYMPRNIHWDKKTPIGGYWDWDNNNNPPTSSHIYAGLVVNNPNRTTLQMKEIDEKLDDGNLATGNFRRHENGYIFIALDK